MTTSPTGRLKAPKEREKTVSFYEVMEVGTHENLRMDPADWNSILTQLGTRKLGDLVWVGLDRTLIGEPLVVDGVAHLKLMKVRDEEQWLEVYDESAATVTDLVTDGLGLLVETSIIAFTEVGNVFGIIQGSTSAPTASSLTLWLNGLGVIDVEVDIEPLVAAEAARKLEASSEISRIQVTAHTSKASALKQRGVLTVSKVLKQVSEDYGPMTVTVIFKASRAKDQVMGRAALREEAANLLAAEQANEVAKVNAKLIFFDSDTKSHSEDVDFARQRITAKRKVPTTSSDGSPIRNSSAVKVILSVAREHEADLRQITGIPAPKK